jgi:type IV pilus assembly protein PilN
VIKINLAPPTTRTQRVGSAGAETHLGVVFGALGLVLVVALAASWWMLSTQVWSLRRDIGDGRKELDRLKPIIAEGQRYRQEKQELERRIAAIEMVARNQARPTYLLDSLVDMLPADLWLTRVEEKSQQLRLAGTTHSSVALADFMANLKASGKFKDVDLIDSRQDLSKSPRTITFEVSCQFEI